MIDGLTILLALPDFLHSQKYPQLFRLAVLACVVGTVVAALVVSLHEP